MNRRAAGLGFAILAVASCGSEQRAEHIAVRDSAGVRFVVYQEPLFELGSGWSVDSIPTVVIGVAEGDPDYELDDVVTAVRLQDGTIVIADRGRNQLLAYDASGEFLRALGSPGEGPGEFRSIGWLQLAGTDTLLVFDHELRRVSAFTPDGGFAGSIQVPGAGFALPGDFRTTNGVFILAISGSEVWDGIRSGTIRPGVTARNRTYVTAFSAGDQEVDTIARFDGYEEAVVDRDGVATMYAPWGRTTSHTLTSDGRIVVGTQEAGELEVLDERGHAVAFVRWPAGDLSITADHVHQFHDVMFLRIDDPAEKQVAIDRLGELPLPETRAAHGKLLADARGRVWIAEAHLPLTSAREWRAIDLASGDVARIAVPSGFDLLWIGEEEVLGRTRDELGVQRVEARRLRRGS